jgi:hypothetical protein
VLRPSFALRHPTLPTYLRTQSPHHARFLAIDVTIPAPPPSSDASTTAATATTQHHQAERAKFSVTGNRSYVRVFEDLVNQQILLLPFTVDHLGGIGTLGHRLLFGHDPHKAPNQLPLNHLTATASYFTTLPTVHSPVLTSYAVPTKTGPDPTLITPASAPPTTPAYQATGHNNS